MAYQQTLADQIVEALQRADKENEPQVAEYLLLALEALVEKEEREFHMRGTYSDLLRSLRSGRRP